MEADIEPAVPEDVPQVRLDYDNVLNHALQNNALATTMRRRQMEADYAVASARANRQSINLYAQLGYTGTGDNMNSAYRNATRWSRWASPSPYSTGASARDSVAWPSRTAKSSKANSGSRHRTSARTFLY